MNKLKRNEANDVGTQRTYPLVKSLLLIIISFFAGFAVHATLDITTQSSAEMTDPLLAYTSVLPGQPAGALATHGFACHSVYNYYDPQASRCILDSPSDPLSGVYAMTSGSTIQHLIFVAEMDAIAVGNLLELWGEPEIQEHSKSVYLFWRQRNIVAIAPSNGDGYSPSLSVWRFYVFA